METNCRCGNFGCAIRLARGLQAFCAMPAPVRAPVECFYSYRAACEAAEPGQKAVRLGAQGDGGPKRFVLVSR